MHAARSRAGTRVLNAALAAVLAIGLAPGLAYAGESAGGSPSADPGLKAGAVAQVADQDAPGAQQDAQQAEADAEADLPAGTVRAAKRTALAVQAFFAPESIFEGGQGTAEDPYVIADVDQFYAFRDAINSGDLPSVGAYFLLASDIDLAGSESNQWVPIGDTVHPFQGTFDGGYHVISGLYINTDEANQGLFGYVGSGAGFENFIVRGEVTSTGNGVGGVLGGGSGGGTLAFKNVGNEANINARGYSGGIVGQVSVHSMESCWNAGTVKTSMGSNARIGGLNGFSVDKYENCANYGDVIAASGGYGFLGYSPSRTSPIEMTGCLNIGNVITTGTGKTGAFAGNIIDAYVTESRDNFYLETSADGPTPGTSALFSAGCTPLSVSELRSQDVVEALGDAWVFNPQGYPMLKAQVAFMGAPTFSQQPEGAGYELGDQAEQISAQAELPVLGDGANGRISYQWLRGGAEDGSDAAAIPGEVYTSVVPTTDAPGISYYFCEATNTYGDTAKTTRSQAAKVIVTDSATEAAVPRIVGQPQGGVADFDGAMPVLSVVAKVAGDGAGALSYQWYAGSDEDGSGAEAIEGATGKSLTALQQEGVTYYYCVVTNTYQGATTSADATSDIAVVRVGPEGAAAGTPIVIAQPQGAEYAQNAQAEALVFEVATAVKGDLSYQWYKATDEPEGESAGDEGEDPAAEPAAGPAGEAIEGATSASFVPPTSEAGAFDYFCVATNQLGEGNAPSVQSETVMLAVTSATDVATPSFTIQPESASVSIGQAVELKVQVAEEGEGIGDIDYQWYLSDGGTNESGEAIEGATSTTFAPDTMTGGDFAYYCVVTNTFEGVKVASAASEVATVSVDPVLYISNADEMMAFARSVNEDLANYYGATVVLTNDIDLTGVDWEPIGGMASGAQRFYGTFDGGYHSITLDSKHGGLFGRIHSGAVLQNFVLKGNVTFENPSATQYLSAVTTYVYANTSGTNNSVNTPTPDVHIRNVGNEANVNCTGRASKVAGFVASTSLTSADLYFENCYNTGTITNTGTQSAAAAAGFLASMSAASRAYFVNCYNGGDITGSGGTYTGGICSYGGTFTNCFGYGVMNKGTCGIAGYNGRNSTQVNCYTPAGLYRTAAGSGTSLSEDEMKKPEFINTIGDAFVYNEGGYPKLDWELHAGVPTITAQPQGASYAVGATADALSVTVALPANNAAGADGTLSYQWYSNDTASTFGGMPIQGATAASYEPSAATAGATYYYCVVTNTYGTPQASASATSQVALVAVLDEAAAAVNITEQPADVATTQGKEVTLKVTAALVETGKKGELAYQWYKNDKDSTDGGALLEGETAATLSFTATDFEAAYYYCEVSNRVDGLDLSTVASEPAEVTSDVTVIETAEDLAAFRDKVNAGTSYWNYTVVLANDIDLSSVCSEDLGSWVPIGNTKPKAFKGTFDGQGHAVKGLYAKGSYQGLFGYADGATICNLTVEGSVSGAYSALFVSNMTDCAISDVVTKGELVSSGASFYAGAVVSEATDTAFLRCGNEADVTGTENTSRFGGLAGNITSCTFTSCYNVGAITHAGTKTDARFAGLVGNLSGVPLDAPSMVDCYNTGAVTGQVGMGVGLFAFMTESTGDVFVNCYNAGEVSVEDGVAYAIANAKSVGEDNSYYVESESATSSYGQAVPASEVASAAFLEKLGSAYKVGPGHPILAWQDGEGYPTIEGAPEGFVLTQGQRPAALTVSAALPAEGTPGSDGALSYQWFTCADAQGANPVKVEGATDASLSISSFDDVGAYWYFCEATNTFADEAGASVKASTSTAPVEVTIVSTTAAAEPVFTTQPESVYIERGGSAETLTAVVDETPAAGVGEITYQWYESIKAAGAEDIAIEGATGTTYTPPASRVSERAYYCLATNTFEGVKVAESKSDVAHVTVWDRDANSPVIGSQPAANVGPYAQGSQIPELAVEASLPAKAPGNTGALTYQWYRNTTGVADPEADTAVAGATTPSCTPDSTLDADVYYYYCVVTNTFKTLGVTQQTTSTSSLVRIGIVTAEGAAVPVFTTQPSVDGTAVSELAVKQGDAATKAVLHAEATAESEGTDGAPIAYQWFRNETMSTEGSIAIGEGQDCTIDGVGLYVGTYYYYCVATNRFDESTVSDFVRVSIEPVLLIGSAEELVSFNNSVVSGSHGYYAGYTVQLTADIDLGGADWTPIGNQSWSAFKGEFDGQGHTIKGLKIANKGSYAGFFKYVQDAYIHDFTLEGSIEANGDSAAVVGWASNATVIKNVCSNVDIQGTASAAGILGNVGGSTMVVVDSCSNKGAIAAARYASGIAVGGSYTLISNCYNAGTITAAYPAGIAYYYQNPTAYDTGCKIANSFNVGGLISTDTTGDTFPIAHKSNANTANGVTNSYYLDSTLVGEAGAEFGTSMADSQMKGAAFAETLGAAFKATDSYPILNWETDTVSGAPMITTQPIDGFAAEGSTPEALAIAAELPEGYSDTMSYQWYAADSADVAGEAVEGATSATFAPPTTAAGTTYYYCVVANDGNGASAVSDAAKFTVTSATPVDLASDEVAVEPIAAQSYTGAPIMPDVVVLHNGQAVDPMLYTVGYADNTAVGDNTAKVTVTAKENSGFSGSRTATFTIQATDISACDFEPIADQVWTGEQIKPAVAVSYEGVALPAESLTLEYGENTAVGEGTVSVSAKENSGFSGTKELTFNIIAIPIDGAQIAPIEPVPYTGAAAEPAVTVTLSGKELSAETDYDVAYSDNTAAGEATVTVTGKGNYGGSASATFQILQADFAGVSVDEIPAQVYTGEAIEPAVSATFGGNAVAASDYTVAYEANVAAGTAKAILTPAEGGNFTGSPIEAEFAIAKASQAAPTGIAVGNVSVEGLADGAIYGVDDAMEYQLQGADGWSAVPEGADSIEGLPAGDYLVRYKADDNHEAGAPASVEVGFDAWADNSLALEGEADFGTLLEGYAAPEAAELTLSNEGNVPATGLACTFAFDDASQTADALGAELSADSVEAGGTVALLVAPKAGLAAGDYSGTLTVASAQNPEGASVHVALAVGRDVAAEVARAACEQAGIAYDESKTPVENVAAANAAMEAAARAACEQAGIAYDPDKSVAENTDAAAAAMAAKAAEDAARAACEAAGIAYDESRTPAENAAAASEAAASAAAASSLKANPMTVKAKALKAKAKKKTPVKKAKAFQVKGAKGKVEFYKVKGSAKVKVAKSGKVTVKKGLKKGKTVKVKVLVMAKGDKQFAPKAQIVTLKVKVK